MDSTFYFAWEPALMVWLQSHLGSFGITLATILILGFCYWSWKKELGKFPNLLAYSVQHFHSIIFQDLK